MKILIKSQLLLFIIILISCNSTKNGKKTVDSVNSNNAFNWSGIYKGTMPCADCSGIETELILSQNKTYTLNTQYLGKSNEIFNETGVFNWNAKEDIITLSIDGNPSQYHQYKVLENKIIKLDNEGNEISGVLNENYILSKTILATALNKGEQIYWVNSTRAECTGASKMICLQIQKGDALKPKGWQLFYNKINGFDFEAGYIYKLIVKEEKRPENEVPADASAIKYTLVKMLEKTTDNKIRLHDIWALQAVNDEIIDIKNYNKRPSLEINISTNKVMGNDGCNHFTGVINSVDSKKLSFNSLASTRKACSNMEFYNLINKHLSDVQSYKIENLALLLFNAEGKELLRYKKVD